VTIRPDVIPSQLHPHSDLNPDAEASPKRDGRVFRAMRQERGLTQRDVAGGSGVTQNTIARLERGEPVTMSTLRKVTAYLATVAVDPLLSQLLPR